MKKTWYLIPLLLAFLSTDCWAFKFNWMGKSKNQATQKAEKLCNEASRAYGSADYAKVIELTTQAIKEDAKYAKSYMMRGRARKDMGDIDNAFKDLDQAITLDPKLGEAYFIRGQANEIMGEMDKAAEDYKNGCASGYKMACE